MAGRDRNKMNNVYEKITKAISYMSSFELRKFVGKVKRGYCYDKERPETVCVSMWAQAEHDARKKELFKISKITLSMKRENISKEERAKRQKEITSLLKSAEIEGCNAANIERTRQIGILRDMGILT